MECGAIKMESGFAILISNEIVTVNQINIQLGFTQVSSGN